MVGRNADGSEITGQIAMEGARVRLDYAAMFGIWVNRPNRKRGRIEA